MTTYSDLDRLVAGLLSHGFREEELAPVGWRVFHKLGRETRFLRERDLLIVQGEDIEAQSLWMPLYPKPGQMNSYHQLLFKCGDIQLRTWERAEYRRAEARLPKQRALDLDADEMLEQLGGSI